MSEVDDRELRGLDPIRLWELESTRVFAHFPPDEDDDLWHEPSRCEGWTRRDVLAHLTAEQEYFQACLDGTVAQLLGRLASEGARGVDDFNEMGIRSFDDEPNLLLLMDFDERDGISRNGFRARGDGMVDTSVGPYPARWQAFHLASEIATHADDVYVVVPENKRAERLDWRARFSRFALREAKPHLEVERKRKGNRVRGDGVELLIDDETLVAAVAGRLPDDAGLDARARALLSTMPS